MEKYDAPELTSFGTVADLTAGGGDDNPERRAARSRSPLRSRYGALRQPELSRFGTVADLTEGGGDDNPEASGSTFPITDGT